MAYLFLSLIALLLLLLALRAFVSTNPQVLAGRIRVGGGFALVGLAGFLALTGRMAVAVPLFAFALSLMGRSVLSGTFGRRTRKSAGGRSTVRSRFVEMILDHDTGAMEGVVLAGHYAGATLDALDRGDLERLLAEASADAESVSLVEAYLDRRTPGWREHVERDAAAAGFGAASGTRPLTEQEAHEILGLEPGAGEDDIRRAHRALMKKLHPDQGGSTYLATKVNEAKDVLLHKHRGTP